MKRSQYINLDLMRKTTTRLPRMRPLAVAIAAISLAACSSKEEVKVVSSVEDCVANTTFTQAQCEVAYKNALEEAARTSPRYNSRSQCESEFGQGYCQNNGSNFFVPLMAGFIIGQALDGIGSHSHHRYNPVYQYRRPYSSNHNRFMMADGSILGRAGQRSFSVSSSSLKPKPTVTKTVSRGGFGSRASAKSSWGGGSKSRGWGG